MERQVSFTGRFDVVSRQSLSPGGWYIGFRCRRCRQHFAIMDEPTNSGELGLSGDAVFHASCPSCGQSSDYTAADLVLFESAQGGPTSTA